MPLDVAALFIYLSVLAACALLSKLVRLLLWRWRLRWRQTKHLSPSRFAAAVGIHPFRPREELWQILKGNELQESEEAKKAKQYGIEMEGVAFEVYVAWRLAEAPDAHPFSIVKGPSYNKTNRRSTKFPWLDPGIPDGLILDQNGRTEGILEIKCRYSPEAYTVPHQTLSSIYYYMPQIQGYMELYDVEYADLMSFTPRGSVVFRVRRDRRYWALLVPPLKEFYDYLQRDHPPPPSHEYTDEIRRRSCEMEWE